MSSQSPKIPKLLESISAINALGTSNAQGDNDSDARQFLEADESNASGIQASAVLRLDKNGTNESEHHGPASGTVEGYCSNFVEDGEGGFDECGVDLATCITATDITCPTTMQHRESNIMMRYDSEADVPLPSSYAEVLGSRATKLANETQRAALLSSKVSSSGP